ncbi:hypothetical protein CMO83_02315 [Candidatus Woesearchaeota archaeon]|nr:hypothetical protein [Candidatus Woesearchaeota archaeon]MDP6648308.1 DUF460 domain-containing protein [Candidatus Woesearchaeota archaeon]|tara:strand:- start:5734 stop:6906 length:1173 start_codon:yes stop_codon:yes gene_type:complete
MEEKKLLIVGIDPGTTTGYAVLDIQGNLIHLNSSKQLELKSLISQTMKLGKAILVGTDKSKIPNLVEMFSTKLGARVVNPEEDLKVLEKRKIINGFGVNDNHQGDALASALFAYKAIKPLLDRIDFFVKENKKYHIEKKIKEYVVAKRISIKSAVSILEKRVEEDKIIEKVIIEKKLDENDFLKLYNKVKKFETDIKLMKNHNNNLKNRLNRLEKINIKIKESKNYTKKQPDYKENRIRFLENLIKSKDIEIRQLINSINKFNNVLSDINNNYILKKLDTFGLKDFNFRNKFVNIRRNDILLVDDPNIVSNDVVGLLRDKVFVVIHKKAISAKIEKNLPFVFMDANNLNIEEGNYFGFIGKNQFENEKNRINWAKKIIDDYKREKELIPV